MILPALCSHSKFHISQSHFQRCVQTLYYASERGRASRHKQRTVEPSFLTHYSGAAVLGAISSLMPVKICAKPTPQATVYRLPTHELQYILPSLKIVFFVYLQWLTRFYEGIWGARAQVFESLRPDHIIQ